MNDEQPNGSEDRERALRMLALQIVGQLPANFAEAEQTLEYARALLTDYLHSKPGKSRQPLRIVT